MKSVKHIYKKGVGPSSSHTMGPVFAAKEFVRRYPACDRIVVTLFGSLAKTGRGHGTDRAILETLSDYAVEIVWNSDENVVLEHPNTMDFEGFRNGASIAQMRALSIGGGQIRIAGEESQLAVEEDVYPMSHFTEIAEYCKARNIRLSDYVFEREDQDFPVFLLDVWHTMEHAIREGLTHTGTLPRGHRGAKKGTAAVRTATY